MHHWADTSATLPPSQNTVTLSFDDVETIIDAELPPSATVHHHQWWANQSYGSRALHWDAAGFRVDHVEVKPKRLVRFARKDAVARPPRPLTLQQVVTEVNEGAHTRRIEDLQEWRRELRGLTRLPSATLFAATLKKEDRHYAFHVGGLTELQFNVGFEPVKGVTAFRHGVAFSAPNDARNAGDRPDGAKDRQIQRVFPDLSGRF